MSPEISGFASVVLIDHSVLDHLQKLVHGVSAQLLTDYQCFQPEIASLI